MKAIAVYNFGGPDALQVVDLPEPQPGPGEIRIRVHAAAVNPTDVLLRTGGHAVRMPDRRPPFVPGMDAAGVIDALGPGTGGRLDVGQHVIAMVLFTSHRGGAYAEQVVVPAASVVPAPAGADFPAASTLLMNALTARLALDALALQTVEVLPAIADGGTLAELRGWPGPAERGIRVRPVMVSDRITDTDALDRLRRQAEDGALTLRVAEVLPAQDAARAHRMLEAGGLRGRLVLDFS